MPVQTGIHHNSLMPYTEEIPASAGMTKVRKDRHNNLFA